MKITLNCDLGEGLESDKDVMPYLNWANIACGGHAGDLNTMLEALSLAMEHGVLPVAHPGYPDKENFGRKVLDMTSDEISQFVRDQIVALARLAEAAKTELVCVKPHGALNNEMCINDTLLGAVCEGIVQSATANRTIMVPVTGRRNEIMGIVGDYGLSIVWEVFADRAYEQDGTLRSRKLAGAVHADVGTIIDQTEKLIKTGKVATPGGEVSLSPFHSICIHGDNTASVMAARELRNLLDKQISD